MSNAVRLPPRRSLWRSNLLVIGVLIGLFLGVVVWDVIAKNRAQPPGHVTDFRSFAAWCGDSYQLYESVANGQPITIATSRTGALLPSGPAGYVFDADGRLITWSDDIGDDYSFDQKGYRANPWTPTTRPFHERKPSSDWRRGEGICDVHKKQMETREVYGLEADIDPTPEYAEARATLFPNAGIDYGPEHYSQERGLIYVCTECEAAREQWRQEPGVPLDTDDAARPRTRR